MRADELLADQQNHGEFKGITVRKGTVGAFLVNARTWCAPTTSASERLGAERDILEALPALRALGLFEVLDVHDEKLRALIAEN